MARRPRSFRLYCSVYGCLNSSLSEPDITFFKLPTQPARLSEWLRLMCRDDLSNRSNITGYRVCEKHFNVQDILPSTNRKLLKKNALPAFNLPDFESTIQGGSRKQDKQTQTENRKAFFIQHEVSPLLTIPDDSTDALLPDQWINVKGFLSIVYLCKVCNKNIGGFRYRCLVCPDFEMCGWCERKGAHIDEHYLLRVPTRRPVIEVEQVELAVRRALSSFPAWNKAKSTVEVEKTSFSNVTGNESDKTKNLEDKTGNESEDETSENENDPGRTLDANKQTVTGADEPVVKVEFVFKEEMDPLEGDAVHNIDKQTLEPQNVRPLKIAQKSNVSPKFDVTPEAKVSPASKTALQSEVTQKSKSAEKSQVYSLGKVVSTSQLGSKSEVAPAVRNDPPSEVGSTDDPPSKRRRNDDECFTTTTHSHSNNTVQRTKPSEKATSRTAASSETESKVDVFVLKKRTLPTNKNKDN